MFNQWMNAGLQKIFLHLVTKTAKKNPAGNGGVILSKVY